MIIKMNVIHARTDYQHALPSHIKGRYGILDEPDEGRHEGGRGLRDLCSTLNPKYHICGHIHETAGAEGNHFNAAYPQRKNIVKIEYYSGEYEFIKVK